MNLIALLLIFCLFLANCSGLQILLENSGYLKSNANRIKRTMANDVALNSGTVVKCHLVNSPVLISDKGVIVCVNYESRDKSATSFPNFTSPVETLRLQRQLLSSSKAPNHLLYRIPNNKHTVSSLYESKASDELLGNSLSSDNEDDRLSRMMEHCIQDPTTKLVIPHLFRGPYRIYKPILDYLPEFEERAFVKCSDDTAIEYRLIEDFCKERGLDSPAKKMTNKGITLANGFRTDLVTLRRAIDSTGYLDKVLYMLPNGSVFPFLGNQDKVERMRSSEIILVKFESGYTIQWPIFRDILRALNSRTEKNKDGNEETEIDSRNDSKAIQTDDVGFPLEDVDSSLPNGGQFGYSPPKSDENNKINGELSKSPANLSFWNSYPPFKRGKMEETEINDSKAIQNDDMSFSLEDVDSSSLNGKSFGYNKSDANNKASGELSKSPPNLSFWNSYPPFKSKIGIPKANVAAKSAEEIKIGALENTRDSNGLRHLDVNKTSDRYYPYRSLENEPWSLHKSNLKANSKKKKVEEEEEDMLSSSLKKTKHIYEPARNSSANQKYDFSSDEDSPVSITDEDRSIFNGDSYFDEESPTSDLKKVDETNLVSSAHNEVYDPNEKDSVNIRKTVKPDHSNDVSKIRDSVPYDSPIQKTDYYGEKLKNTIDSLPSKNTVRYDASFSEVGSLQSSDDVHRGGYKQKFEDGGNIWNSMRGSSKYSRPEYGETFGPNWNRQSTKYSNNQNESPVPRDGGVEYGAVNRYEDPPVSFDRYTIPQGWREPFNRKFSSNLFPTSYENHGEDTYKPMTPSKIAPSYLRDPNQRVYANSFTPQSLYYPEKSSVNEAAYFNRKDFNSPYRIDVLSLDYDGYQQLIDLLNNVRHRVDPYTSMKRSQKSGKALPPYTHWATKSLKPDFRYAPHPLFGSVASQDRPLTKDISNYNVHEPWNEYDPEIVSAPKYPLYSAEYPLGFRREPLLQTTKQTERTEVPASDPDLTGRAYPCKIFSSTTEDVAEDGYDHSNNIIIKDGGKNIILKLVCDSAKSVHDVRTYHKNYISEFAPGIHPHQQPQSNPTGTVGVLDQKTSDAPKLRETFDNVGETTDEDESDSVPTDLSERLDAAGSVLQSARKASGPFIPNPALINRFPVNLPTADNFFHKSEMLTSPVVYSADRNEYTKFGNRSPVVNDGFEIKHPTKQFEMDRNEDMGTQKFQKSLFHHDGNYISYPVAYSAFEAQPSYWNRNRAYKPDGTSQSEISDATSMKDFDVYSEDDSSFPGISENGYRHFPEQSVGSENRKLCNECCKICYTLQKLKLPSTCNCGSSSTDMDNGLPNFLTSAVRSSDEYHDQSELLHSSSSVPDQRNDDYYNDIASRSEEIHLKIPSPLNTTEQPTTNEEFVDDTIDDEDVNSNTIEDTQVTTDPSKVVVTMQKDNGVRKKILSW